MPLTLRFFYDTLSCLLLAESSYTAGLKTITEQFEVMETHVAHQHPAARADRQCTV